MVGPVQEKLAERLIPSYLKQKLTQLDGRLDNLEAWRSSSVSQWAAGVDNAIDKLQADQSSLASSQSQVADALRHVTGDAVDAAMVKLALPEGAIPSDVGDLVSKIRNQTKDAGHDLFINIHDIVVASYDTLMNWIRLWNDRQANFRDLVLNRYQDIIGAAEGWKEIEAPIENFMYYGTLPAKASTMIQGWISKQADAIKGTISAQQLSTDRLNAIAALLNNVPGTSTKLIDTLSGVSQWYNGKEAWLNTKFNSYVTAYQSDNLPAFIKSNITGYLDTADFKAKMLAKLDTSDITAKLKGFLMNIPGVEGFVDKVAEGYRALRGFIDKIVEKLKDLRQRFHLIRVNDIEGNLEVMGSLWTNNLKKLKADLDRDPGVNPGNIKQYCQDAINDVRGMVDSAISSLKVTTVAVGKGFEDAVTDLTDSIRAFVTDEISKITMDVDGIKAGIRSSPT